MNKRNAVEDMREKTKERLLREKDRMRNLIK